jgi:hypothetical protein
MGQELADALPDADLIVESLKPVPIYVSFNDVEVGAPGCALPERVRP